jgi:hypothetical protein
VWRSLKNVASEDFGKLRFACSCTAGDPVPSRQNTLASSPGPLESLGLDQRYVYGFAALYSLISTRAGALPKIYRHYRQTTKSGELCVVKACNERRAWSKACNFLLTSADTRCGLLQVVPRMKPQDHVPSSTFHGPFKQ